MAAEAKRVTDALERAHAAFAGQVHQLALGPNTTVPASPLAPTDGPMPRIGTPEHFAGGPETCGAYAVTHPLVRQTWVCFSEPRVL